MAAERRSDKRASDMEQIVRRCGGYPSLGTIKFRMDQAAKKPVVDALVHCRGVGLDDL